MLCQLMCTAVYQMSASLQIAVMSFEHYKLWNRSYGVRMFYDVYDQRVHHI